MHSIDKNQVQCKNSVQLHQHKIPKEMLLYAPDNGKRTLGPPGEET
jgi:hypothetical protein